MIKISKLVPSYTWRDLPYLQDEIWLSIYIGLYTLFICWFCIQCWNEIRIVSIIGLILFVFCVIGNFLVSLENTDD